MLFCTKPVYRVGSTFVIFIITDVCEKIMTFLKEAMKISVTVFIYIAHNKQKGAAPKRHAVKMFIQPRKLQIPKQAV